MYLAHVRMYAFENMLRKGLGSWIKPLRFDLCQSGLWNNFSNDITPQKKLKTTRTKQQDFQVDNNKNLSR
jgi:hypothetical protein